MATGLYQFKDTFNMVTVMQFCAPFPDLKTGSIVMIEYLDKKDNCYPFISAHILEGK